MKKLKRLRETVACVIVSIVLMLTVNVHAGKITVIEGLIEQVIDETITVRGSSYDLSTSILLDTAGNKLLKDKLATGKKVEIFFEDKQIKSVVLHIESVVD